VKVYTESMLDTQPKKCSTTMPSPVLSAETKAYMHGKGGANLVTGKMGGHAGPLEIL